MKTLSILSLFIFTMILSSCQQSSVADELRAEANNSSMKMYVIERNIPNAGQLTTEELQGISQVSCNVLDELGNDITWLHSYVTDNKVFCVYKATNEELIQQHAAKGGFPADAIEQVSTIIDPSTAN